jgi:hypothetical protein
VILTHLVAIVFLYQRYHPEDGCDFSKLVVKVITIKIHYKILVVNTFYTFIPKVCSAVTNYETLE